METFKETHKSVEKLETCIGIKKSNIELLLYTSGMSPYDGEYEFGTIEVTKDGKVVLECGCSGTIGDESDNWSAMSIHYASSDVDWIQSVKEFKEHLIHQENLDELEGEIGSADFLINRHKT